MFDIKSSGQIIQNHKTKPEMIKLSNHLAEEHVLQRTERQLLLIHRVIRLECLVEVGEGGLEILFVGSVQNTRLEIQGGLNVECTHKKTCKFPSEHRRRSVKKPNLQKNNRTYKLQTCMRGCT